MARPRKPDPKGTRLTVRFTAAEASAVSARADAAGIDLSALVRAAVLRQPPPARRRRPHVADRSQLAQVLGAVGRIGGNVNQLARTANMGGWPEAAALNEAVRDIQLMRSAVMLALGYPQPSAPSIPFPKG